MLRHQWNALAVGDRVLVHDDHDRWEAPLVEGTVVSVQAHADTNDLAIRIPGVEGLIRPRRAAVHMTEFGPREICWRCEAIAAAAWTKPSVCESA